ncbi:hypothetical protein CEXT_775081 [Caerostris extrusa]|uniref:Uncharacterized protein n=1 Tax=Caerostris extrusa TaxID=172846 RepID=A0AAV4N7Z6_CAEEX|nr:hypothetical protein CEXT_775081 [Caerostris extrusa]
MRRHIEQQDRNEIISSPGSGKLDHFLDVVPIDINFIDNFEMIHKYYEGLNSVLINIPGWIQYSYIFQGQQRTFVLQIFPTDLEKLAFPSIFQFNMRRHIEQQNRERNYFQSRNPSHSDKNIKPEDDTTVTKSEKFLVISWYHPC